MIHAWIANAEAIRQITERRTSFPKPTGNYKVLDIFGRNVVTTEGVEWKAHRKATSASFNEKNNSLVFAESCSQAQGMLRRWSSMNEKEATIYEAATDTLRLALFVISNVGFGVRLLWPGENAETRNRANTYIPHEIPKGYSMSFQHALTTVAEQVHWIVLVPGWILSEWYQSVYS